MTVSSFSDYWKAFGTTLKLDEWSENFELIWTLAVSWLFLFIMLYNPNTRDTGVFYGVVMAFLIGLYTLQRTLGKSLGASYGIGKKWFLYLAVAGGLGVLSTYIPQGVFAALGVNPAAILIIPSAFLFVVPLYQFIDALISLAVTGIFISATEEHFIEKIEGVTARYALSPAISTWKKVLIILVVSSLAFTPLHIFIFSKNIEIQWSQYQLSKTTTAPVACAQGNYFNYNTNTCLPVPPQPGTNEAVFYLLLMLAWLTFFLRIPLTLASIAFNSKWVRILGHSFHNIIVVSLFDLQQPLFLVLGFMLLMVFYFAWLRGTKKPLGYSLSYAPFVKTQWG